MAVYDCKSSMHLYNGLRQLVYQMPRNPKHSIVCQWVLHIDKLADEDVIDLVLCKEGTVMHRTRDVEDMIAYVRAVIALKGKQ